RRARPFARELDDHVAREAGVFLLPCGSERPVVVIRARIIAAQTAVDAVLRHEQVINSGDEHSRAVRKLDGPRGHAAERAAIGAEIVELDVDRDVAAAEEGERRLDLVAIETILEQQVPLALFTPPAKARGAHR